MEFTGHSIANRETAIEAGPLPARVHSAGAVIEDDLLLVHSFIRSFIHSFVVIPSQRPMGIVWLVGWLVGWLVDQLVCSSVRCIVLYFLFI